MTLGDLLKKLEAKKNSRYNGLSEDQSARLDAIILRLQRLCVNHGSDAISRDIYGIVSNYIVNNHEFAELESYLNAIDAKIEEAVKRKGAPEQDHDAESAKKTEKTDGTSKRASKSRFLKALPWLVGVGFSALILIIGVSLGLTVLEDKQDAWYFTLECIKDIVAGVIPGTITVQAINSKRDEKDKPWIPIVSSIGGIFAMVVSIVLCCEIEGAFFERFTNLGKAAYIVVALTFILIAIASATSLIFYFWKRLKEKQKGTQENSEDTSKQEETNATDEK